MTDNRNSYNVIKRGLEQLYPGKVNPRMAQHLHTIDNIHNKAKGWQNGLKAIKALANKRLKEPAK